MMKMLTAHTLEIDDVEVAVAEILAQLDIENSLLAQSVGIIACYPEFLESGVMEALKDALPFEILGCTTLSSSTDGASDGMQLCLSVITGDALTFSTAYATSLREGDMEDTVKSLYAQTLPAHKETPKLVMAFLPLLQDIAGELIFQMLNDATGNVPVFGTLACDPTSDFIESYAIHGSKYSDDGMALLTISGDLEPRFFVTSISEERISRHRAVITESDGYVLQKANDMLLVDYMETLGLTRNNGLDAIRSLPFIIDYNDGTKPVARAILQMTPEGYAVCCGFTPVNATLAVGTIDAPEILKTAKDITDTFMKEKDIHGILIHPCSVRNYTLGSSVMAELDAIAEEIGGRAPYMASYSGGELCPVYQEDGSTVNRFHNYTIVACVF